MAVPSVLDSALDQTEEGWYESSVAPQDALGRAARKLLNGGALYLGGGVGVEKVGEKFALTGGGKRETHPGPLSAVTAAFSRAGGSTAPDTPGGAKPITDPNAAARLRELFEEEKDSKRDLDRLEARKRRTEANTFGLPMRGPSVWDAYDESRLAELRSRLAQIETERKRLLAGGSVEEALAEAESGKPGTNWKQIGPREGAKLGPLVRHYMSKPHPFGACVRDNRKRFGDRAERVCAVLKDYGSKTTKWRKGGKAREAIERELIEVAGEARERLLAIEEAFGEGKARELAEASPADLPSNLHRQLAEMAYADRSLLFLMGWMSEEELHEGTRGPGDPPPARARGRRGRGAGERAAQRVGRGQSSGRTTSGKRKPPPPANSGSSSSNGKGGEFAGSKPGGGYIQVGAEGAPAKAVQGKVGAKTDGKFGKQTEKAVRKFQAKHGLKVDGVVGRQTAAAFEGKKGAKNLKTGAMSAKQQQALGGKPKRKRVREGAQPDPFGSLLTEAPWDSSLHPRGGFSRNRGLFSPAGILVENPDLYFTRPAGSIEVDLDKLTPDHEEPKSTANALKRMAQAAAGKMDKRKPISLRDNGDGTFHILDGNATFHAHRAAGFSKIRALVTERPKRRRLRLPQRSGARRSWFDPTRPDLMNESLLTEAPWDSSLHPRGGRRENRGWFSRKFTGGSRQRSDTPRPTASKPGEEQRGLKGPARQPGGKAPTGSRVERGKPSGQLGTNERVKAARAARVPPSGGPSQQQLIDFDPPDDTKQRLAGMFTGEERGSAKGQHRGVSSEEELFSKAEPALADYKKLLDLGKGVSARIGAKASTPEQALADKSSAHVIIAPLKGRPRSREKVETKYDGDWSKLGDVVRGTIAVQTMDDIPGAVEALRAESKKQGWKITAPENRYVYVEGDHVNTGPVPAGYRDVAVILEAPNGVVAELQINTLAMMEAKQGQGHKLYEQERAVYARAAREGRPLNSQERRRIEELTTQASQLYGQAFADSFSASSNRRARAAAGRRRRAR